MKQRKLERLILDLKDLMDTIDDGTAVDELRKAIDKLEEIHIYDYED